MAELERNAGVGPSDRFVRVLAFAGARDAMGASSSRVDLEAPCEAQAFLERLVLIHPKLRPHQASIRLALNGEYATANTLVRPGDEVAVIPPVSGG